MDGYSISGLLKKNGCHLIGAQTVPNTFSYINASSLLAEQVNNRSSAQWKKANFIICSKPLKCSVSLCLDGWIMLAEKEHNQILFLQGNDGIYRAYNWRGTEIQGSIDEIIMRYKIIKD